MTGCFVLGSALLSASTSWCDESTVLRKLAQAASHLTVADIDISPIPGIHEVEIEEDKARLYVTADGNHLFAGDLYAISSNGLVNLTEARREARRRQALAQLDATDMIVFAPAEAVAAVLYAFTDVDCHYCRQLHDDMARLNDLGIEVRYLAYPRAGPGTPTYDMMVAVWCAENPQAAMTAAKRGETVVSPTCADPVAEQFELGRSLHIGGTPTMVTEGGKQLYGYHPPDELARRLGVL